MGDLETDNGAIERANRDIAIGRGNWTFFGSDNGGFIVMCKRNAVEPFAWFRDVLSRIATHPINFRIEELRRRFTSRLRHNCSIQSLGGPNADVS
jgi:transposase